MTTFDNRERAFEAAFAHDQDVRFRAIGRRNKAFGSWVAERLGKTGDDADAYAKAVVGIGIAQAGDDAVVGKVCADLEAAGNPVDRAEIERRLAVFMNEATVEPTAKL